MNGIPAWLICVSITYLIYGVCLAAEAVCAHRRGLSLYEPRETWANTLILVGFALITGIWSNLVVAPIYFAIHAFAPWHLAENWSRAPFSVPLWQYAALFILDDLCFYIYHRASHRFRVLWAVHETHHSANHYNVSVSAREPWTAIVVSQIFWLPLPLLGFDPLLVITQQWVSLSYQLLIHTPLIRDWGWFERVLNTPSHHRVHHGVNPRYIDRNFGGILILWDHLFGTFEPESEPVEYGIRPALKSRSPLRIVFNGFHQLAREWLRLEHSNSFSGTNSRNADLDALLPHPFQHEFAEPVGRENHG